MTGIGRPFSISDNEFVDINQLLQLHKLPPLTSSEGRMFTKAQINGRMYYSMENKKVTKRNSYTVLYLNSNSASYGTVKHYLYVDDYKFALINNLQCLHTGPPKTFMNNIITVDKDELFENYLTCKLASKQNIFVNQILEKLCNLSFDDRIFITLPVNDVEIE